MIGVCETTSSRKARTRTGQLRGQGSLLVSAVKSRGEGGRKRFGGIAIVLFIGCHSCGAGIARHRRLVSMMTPATVEISLSDRDETGSGLIRVERGVKVGGEGLENIRPKYGLGRPFTATRNSE